MAKAKTSITTENRSGSAADAAAKEKRTEMPLSDLHPFEGHPFKVLDDELMEQTVESIKQIGVVSPLIVRPDPEGGFEILSGHRRLHAAQLAGLETVPVIVKEMDDDAAIIFMVDSNLQRENILPSESVFLQDEVGGDEASGGTRRFNFGPSWAEVVGSSGCS